MLRRHTDRLLAGVPLFEHLSKSQLERVAGLSTRISVNAGRALVQEGLPGREFMVVLEGRAEVRHGERVIAQRGPGEFFGEIALLLERPRTATVTALEDSTLDVIERRDFAALLRSEPSLYEPLVKAMAQRLGKLDE